MCDVLTAGNGLVAYWSCNTSDPEYLAYEKLLKAKPTPMKFIDISRRDPLAKKVKEENTNKDGTTRRFRQSERQAIGLHLAMMYNTAEAWSARKADDARKVGETTFLTAEPASVSEMEFDPHGWLGKHSLPSVVFPVHMKRLLIAYFNEIPHVSPEGAILRLKALPQYRLDVFVEFMLTPMRVMRYFTTLNQHRKDNKIGSKEPVPLSIADSVVDASEYKGIKDKKKLADEIVRRGISILPKSKLCKKNFPREVLI